MFEVKMMTRDEFERIYPSAHDEGAQWSPEQIERAKDIPARPINKLSDKVTDAVAKWRALAQTNGKG